MIIQWFGQSYFKLQIKNSAGQEVVIATDPYSPEIGLTPPKFQADIVTISHEHSDHNNLEAIKGEPFVVNGPGEYETKGVFIYGIPAWHDEKQGKERGGNNIFRFQAEDLNVVHLGDLGHELDDAQLEKLNNVDILLIPVGGGPTIDAKKANEIISEIEPRLIIPMHYKLPGLKYDLKTVEEFLKVSGLPSEKMDKLKISRKDLPQEEMRVVILNI